MIKGILFDVGGILIDISNYNPYLEVANFYNVDFNIAKDVFKRNISLLGNQYTEEQMWSNISKELSSGKNDIPYHILHNHFTESIKNNEKILNLLDDLRRDGLTLAILSDTNPIHKQFLQNIYNYFDRNMVFLSCDIGFRKNNNEAFKIASKKMDLTPKEILFIDDSKENILRAQELNFQTILAKSERQIIEALKRFHLL